MQYIIITHYYLYMGYTTTSIKKLFSNVKSAKEYILSKEPTDFTEAEVISALTNEENLEPIYSWGGNGFDIELIQLIE